MSATSKSLQKDKDNYRVPSSSRRKSSCITSRIVTRCNIIERRCSSRIKKWVQEPEWGFTSSNQPIVQQGDHARKDWAWTACSRDQPCNTRPNDFEVLSLRSNIWETPAGGVKQPGVCGAEVAKIWRNSRVLIRRPREDIRESSSSECGSGLRNTCCCTYWGQAMCMIQN